MPTLRAGTLRAVVNDVRCGFRKPHL